METCCKSICARRNKRSGGRSFPSTSGSGWHGAFAGTDWARWQGYRRSCGRRIEPTLLDAGTATDWRQLPLGRLEALGDGSNPVGGQDGCLLMITIPADQTVRSGMAAPRQVIHLNSGLNGHRQHSSHSGGTPPGQNGIHQVLFLVSR